VAQLPDPAVEEALYESTSMRNFAGIDLGVQTAPDETTVCKFRRSAEFDEELKRGKRDPLMHRTAKGKQWYFGMKAQIGVDSRTKLVHTVLASARTWPIASRCSTRRTGKEGESGVIERTADRRPRSVPGHPGRRTLPTNVTGGANHIDESVRASNRRKSSGRAKVEHVWGDQAESSAFRRPVTEAWPRTCTGSRSPQHSRFCSWYEGDCSMRRELVGESRRTRDCEAQSEDVSAETRHCGDRERDPIVISVVFQTFPKLHVGT
jgi:hypothetical protein